MNRHRMVGEMDARPGTYALILRSDSAVRVRIGRLGVLAATRGYYVYIGSAFGPGGLAARLAHHQRPPRRPHWHIDYLRLHARLIEIWFTHDAQPREHLWADLIGAMRSAMIPLPGFGCSDCRCPSHLFHFARRPSFRSFHGKLHAACGNHARIERAVVEPSVNVQT
jgi:Uri superfamily endonuclease